MIDLKQLIAANVHYGHKKSRWHPKMGPFIWGYKNNIHLINVAKTAQQIEKAAQFLESLASQKKTILWVGTKKVAQDAIAEIGQRIQNPYVIHRWIGGTLTNFPQVKKSLTKLLHYEDVLLKLDQYDYTKKERVLMQKATERLRKNVGSIRNLAWPVEAVVLVDIKKEQTALREAKSLNIPVVALVDTNCDPSLVDYVIPSNDDAASAIKTILNYLADATERGQKVAAERKREAQETQQASIEPDVVVSTLDREAGQDAAKPARKKRVESKGNWRQDKARPKKTE